MTSSLDTVPPLPAGGYAEPAEMVGRPVGEYANSLVLAATAGADLAVFYQILSLVLGESGEWLVLLAVVGFTAGALLLAHFTGRLLRDRAVGYGSTSPWLIAGAALAWALLGTAAFVVRLLVNGRAGDDAAVVTDDSSTTITSAALFLVLYVASGAAACLGAYLSRNPFRTRYRKALRVYRSALKRLRRSRAPYERAVNVLQLHLRNRRREKKNYAAARSLRMAYADEAKQYAAFLIAAHLQDPSATTGLTNPHHRPSTASGDRSDPRGVR